MKVNIAKKFLFGIAILALIAFSVAPTLANAVWKGTPIWAINGEQVDIGFFYDADCVSGPIVYDLVYPADATSVELIESDSPPYGYTVTTHANANLHAGNNHIDVKVKATIPSSLPAGCDVIGVSNITGVRITPISNKFTAATQYGTYSTEMIVKDY